MERPNGPISYEELRRFIGVPGIQLLDYKAEPTGHIEAVYSLTPDPNSPNATKCHQCPKPASFLQYTRDHAAQNFLIGICEEHAPEGYRRLREEKNYG